MERELIVRYEETLAVILEGLQPGNHPLAVQIAKLPEKLRGYGHVKERHIEEFSAEEARLVELFKLDKIIAVAA